MNNNKVMSSRNGSITGANNRCHLMFCVETCNDHKLEIKLIVKEPKTFSGNDLSMK